jgi:hypothetical protein
MRPVYSELDASRQFGGIALILASVREITLLALENR